MVVTLVRGASVKHAAVYVVRVRVGKAGVRFFVLRIRRLLTIVVIRTSLQYRPRSRAHTHGLGRPYGHNIRDVLIVRRIAKSRIQMNANDGEFARLD